MKNKNCRKNFAFTMAEVLITLGVIGIVAAMTIPTLIQNYKKQVVETRLVKFYSVMNNAVAMSEVENGPVQYWDKIERVEIDSVPDRPELSVIKSLGVLEWYNKYLDKYLKTLKVEDFDNREGYITIYFPDGSLAFGGSSWLFYPDAKDFELKDTGYGLDRDKKLSGKKYFTFDRSLECTDNRYGKFLPYAECNAKYNTYSEPNGITSNNSIGCKESVTNERALCTLHISRNGWKIPKDYPLKF